MLFNKHRKWCIIKIMSFKFLFHFIISQKRNGKIRIAYLYFSEFDFINKNLSIICNSLSYLSTYLAIISDYDKKKYFEC